MKIIRVTSCSDCPRFENADCEPWNEYDEVDQNGDCFPLEDCPLEDLPDLILIPPSP